MSFSNGQSTGRGCTNEYVPQAESYVGEARLVNTLHRESGDRPRVCCSRASRSRPDQREMASRRFSRASSNVSPSRSHPAIPRRTRHNRPLPIRNFLKNCSQHHLHYFLRAIIRTRSSKLTALAPPPHGRFVPSSKSAAGPKRCRSAAWMALCPAKSPAVRCWRR